MPALRGGDGCAGKFYTGGIRLYPEENLYREMSFLAYYYHWGGEEISGLDHFQRRRWCREISDIHKSLDSSALEERSILEWGRK